jgi:hypothetical protein
MRTLGSFRKIGGLFLVVVGVAGVCGATYAQADARVITIRLLDSQTGQAIVPIPGDNGISITVNENSANPRLTAHANPQGLWQVTVPADVTKVQFDTPAGPDGFGYVFCDGSKFRPSSLPVYLVADILSTGVEPNNHCSKRFAQAKPGEIIFFVRRPNWHERLPI